MNQRNYFSAVTWSQRIVGSLVFLCAFAFIFYVTGNKVNQYGHSDPLLTLPTAQALVQTGAPYLTHLETVPIAPNGRLLSEIIDNYQATRWNGEIVDVYSPGPALIILPLVFVLDQAGYDLSNIDVNLGVQNRLAFLTSSIALVALFFLCRVYLTYWQAMLVAFTTFFGSSIFANMGLAFFNINFTVIFSTLSLLVLSLLETGRIKQEHRIAAGVLLGVTLFLAFAQRPSAAILILVTFGYLLLNHQKAAIATMATSGTALAILSCDLVK